ncbi:MAG: hypothetical protein WAN86_18390 [Hyphomicrobiaceae bacterium]
MTALPPTHCQTVDKALQEWRQGDVILKPSFFMSHLAVAGSPLTPAAIEAAAELSGGDPQDLLSVESEVAGFVVLTQTCDLVRECKMRPYVQLAPLREVTQEELEQIQRCERPAFAYLPALADRRLIADLDRALTVEKAVLVPLERVSALQTDAEQVAFGRALARNRARFAFPTPFNEAMSAFQKRMKSRAGKNSDEGRHVECLSEIRVVASPSWEAEKVSVTIWLIKHSDPPNPQWTHWLDDWAKLVDQTGAYTLEGPLRLRFLDDMRASEYVASQPLDLDHLSEG